MRCDAAQADLSAAADDALDPARRDRLTEHVAGCAECAAFSAHLRELRRRLRLEPVGEVPDVVAAVMAQLREAAHPSVAPATPRRPRRLAVAAAIFLVGAVAGAAFAGLGDNASPPALAAGLPTRVVAAQTGIDSLSGQVELVESGWHPDVPQRRFTGTLRYQAPESLALRLKDRTRYPSSAWRPNDVDLVVDGPAGTWWSSGLRACPTEALPLCTPPAPRVRAVDGREPFDPAAPIPLDLVLPAASFRLAAAPPDLGTRRLAGREAVGVAVTAAQIAPLLDGLRPAGNLRLMHPTDPADLWLDRETLVVLAVDVRAGDSVDRRRWASTAGYADQPGDVVLRFRLTGLALNQSVPATAFPAPPAQAVTVRQSGGFAPSPTVSAGSPVTGSPVTGSPVAGIPDPASLDPGLRLWRAGTVTSSGGPPVSIASYTDGRAWLVVRATTDWPGGRLFGSPGDAVRRVDLGPAGVGYVAEDGSRVALHANDHDVVVTGSLAPGDLRRAAAAVAIAGVGLVGFPVPTDWEEAATASLDDARRALPGLVVPTGLRGFGPPAVRVEGPTVTLVYAGAGERAFTLVESVGQSLLPPLDPDARAVRVGAREARWPARGELEWVDDGLVVTLRSRTVGLGELARLADRLERR